MRRARTIRLAFRELRAGLSGLAIFSSIVLACLVNSGCGVGDYSCATFVWNPNGLNSPAPSCPTTQGNGNVTVQMTTSFAAAEGPTNPNLEHIYVTLLGIEALPAAANAGEDSADWQELAPEIAKQPVQVDLMAPAGDSCAAHLTARGVVPADVYAEIRLRVASGESGDGGPALEQNACGDAGLNCVVTTRGEKRPLVLDGAAPDLVLGPAQLNGGFFRVLPDEENRISIAFNPYASLAMASGESVKVVPVFTAASDETCESPEPAQNLPY